MSQPSARERRKADRDFLQLLIAIGETLARKAPTAAARQSARRVTRRLKLLLCHES